MKREFTVNGEGVFNNPEKIELGNKSFTIFFKVASGGGYWYFGYGLRLGDCVTSVPCAIDGTKYTTRITALYDAAAKVEELVLRDAEAKGASGAIKALQEFKASLSEKDPSESKDVATAPKSQGFDYSSLTEEEADVARRSVELIRVRLRRTAEDIIEIGRELVRVKDALPHGKFLSWVETEFQMSERAARRFMMAFEKLGKSAKLAVFKPSVVYELAAPSTPEVVRDQAEEAAAKGEKVTLADVQKWKTEATEAKKREAQLARQLKETSRNLTVSDNQNRDLERALKAEKERPPTYVEKFPDDYLSLKQKVYDLQHQITESAKTFAEAQAMGNDTTEYEERIADLESQLDDVTGQVVHAEKAGEQQAALNLLVAAGNGMARFSINPVINSANLRMIKEAIDAVNMNILPFVAAVEAWRQENE